jgi:hypothetical protein
MRISDRYIVVISMGLSSVHVDTHYLYSNVHTGRHENPKLDVVNALLAHPILHPTMMIVVHHDGTAIYVALDCSMP